MLLAIDFYEDLINVEGIAVTSVLPLQSAGIDGTELDAPETDGFSGYSDAPFSEQIFNIPVAQIESIVQPDSKADDVRRESVALISIHPPILAILVS
jgi:hypothetical protein